MREIQAKVVEGRTRGSMGLSIGWAGHQLPGTGP